MLLASVSSGFTSQVAHHGVYAVFGLLALGAVFPAGSELVALVGGAVAAGVFSGVTGVSVFGAHIGSGGGAYVAVAVAAAAGYLAGALAGWLVGRFGGRELLERRGRWLHVTPERLDRADAWFQRWDRPGVLIGTMTPVVRSFVAIPAGIVRVPFKKFLVLAALGSAAFCFGLGAAGWALGSAYTHAHHALRYADYVVLATALLLAAYLVVRVTRRRVSDPAR